MPYASPKREFVAELTQGMGNMFFVIKARSIEEILECYPLLVAVELDQSWIPPERVELLRMYPGEGRPLDSAVQERSPAERERFVAAAIQQRAEARQRYLAANFPVPERDKQRWVDIDDDAEFRMQMHDLVKDDPRYLALPPERRLF